MAYHVWLRAISSASVVWQESGENPFLFCYLIGWGIFTTVREQRPAPIPATERLETACWNPSATCCTRSTILTGSEN